MRAAVEKELSREGKGWLLGSMKQYSVDPSIYDPAAPAFAESDWDHLSGK